MTLLAEHEALRADLAMRDPWKQGARYRWRSPNGEQIVSLIRIRDGADATVETGRIFEVRTASGAILDLQEHSLMYFGPATT